MNDHDCIDWNSGGACYICHKPIPVDVQVRNVGIEPFNEQAATIQSEAPAAHDPARQPDLSTAVSGRAADIGAPGARPSADDALVGRSRVNDVLATLTGRATWYREGCDHLEDRAAYFASGDVARDAASDLDDAVSEIRALRKRIEGWRQWARFVFTHLSAEEIAALTDNELQHAAARGWDDPEPSPLAKDLKGP
jgi:hypothetical protein